MNPRRRRLLLLNIGLAAVLVLVAAGGYFVFLRPSGTADPTGMRTVQVQRGTVESTVTASGSVQPTKSANVDFGTTGTVEKINVGEGDEVDKGDVLARLDDSAQRQALTAARSKLNAAEDSLSEVEDEPDCDSSTTSSSGGGSGGGNGGGQSSCKTDASVSSAQSDVDSAQAGVSQAEADLSATKLKAPMSGTVVAINGTVGSSSVGSGSGSGSSGSGSDSGSGSGSGSGSSSSSSSSGTLDTSSGFVVIADLDTLVVDVSLAESDVGKVKRSQHATVTFPAMSGKSAKGDVRSIDLTGSTSNGVVSYGVRVRLSSVPSGVRVGQTAAISIVTAKKSNVLYLPTVAVHTAGGTSTVQLVRDGKTTTRTVETGIKGDQTTEITSGLKEGDQVVLVTAAQASQAANQNGGGGFVQRGGGGGGGGGNRQPIVVQKP